LISRIKRKAWEVILTIPTTIVAATTAMAGEVGAMAATRLTMLTTLAATITATTITRTTTITIHTRAMTPMTMGEITQPQTVCLIIRADSLVWAVARSLCHLPRGTKVVAALEVEDRAAAFTLAAL